MPDWIQALIYFGGALILLRIGGKRTLSRMTIGEVVIMLGIGTVLIHPLKTKDSWLSLYHGALIILGLIIISFLQIHFPKIKNLILGQPTLLIENGEINRKNLKKARMSDEELEMMLRINKINDMSKVKNATLEISGKIGVELLPQHSFATQKDIEEVKQALKMIGSRLDVPISFDQEPGKPSKNLFRQAEKDEDKDPFQ
ncbi:DUF421 domain-containing protein [Pseudalkalibacillus caeni]|nr:YetF domain-containing protein [Pseudalkalibacillus caeni]